MHDDGTPARLHEPPGVPRGIQVNKHSGLCMSMSSSNALFGSGGRLRGAESAEDLGWSGARGHVGGEDVVRVAVEVLAGAVITHRRAWVSVAGGNLDIPQVHPGVQHGGDE